MGLLGCLAGLVGDVGLIGTWSICDDLTTGIQGVLKCGGGSRGLRISHVSGRDGCILEFEELLIPVVGLVVVGGDLRLRHAVCQLVIRRIKILLLSLLEA